MVVIDEVVMTSYLFREGAGEGKGGRGQGERERVCTIYHWSWICADPNKFGRMGFWVQIK